MIHDLSFADVLFIILVGGVIYGFVSVSGLGRRKNRSEEQDENR